MKISKLRNLPNAISVFRLALVPLFILLYFSSIRTNRLWAGLVFVVAALSDMADGYIARRFQFITALGHVLDPLADKCMQCTAIICLSIDDILPPWIAILLVIKEVLLLFGGLVLFRRYTDCIPSNLFGKATSFLIFVLISFYVLFPDIFREGATWLFLAAILFSIAALVVYAVRGIRVLRTNTLPSSQSIRRGSAPQNNSEVN